LDRCTGLYDALLAGLGAPDWHGRNVNALVDSMIYGDINAIEPPFAVRIFALDRAGADARDAFKEAAEALTSAGAHCCTAAGGSARIGIV